MIPVDRITFTDDGHAWWIVKPVHRMGVTNTVGDDYDDPSWFMSLDRPCGTCDGHRWDWKRCADEDLQVDDPVDYYPCPDCIDGRHTFDIEVEDVDEWDQSFSVNAYRVSVVPGMVLPIVRYSVEANGGPYIVKLSAPKMSGESHCVITPGTEPDGSWQYHSTTLPTAAAPGMFAVKLRVAT
jgi:hypothetical protein